MPMFAKALAAEVDYEFLAMLTRRTGAGERFSSQLPFEGDHFALPHMPQLHRLKAPETNFQTLYSTTTGVGRARGAGRLDCGCYSGGGVSSYRHSDFAPDVTFQANFLRYDG